MNFISEIFELGALQIQPAARGSEGASIGFGSHLQLLVAGKKSTDLLRENNKNSWLVNIEINVWPRSFVNLQSQNI